MPYTITEFFNVLHPPCALNIIKEMLFLFYIQIEQKASDIL